MLNTGHVKGHENHFHTTCVSHFIGHSYVIVQRYVAPTVALSQTLTEQNSNLYIRNPQPGVHPVCLSTGIGHLPV